MNTVLWVLQVVLGIFMLMAGTMKATRGRDQLVGVPKMEWVDDYTDAQVRGIGVSEALAGIGLILPWWLDILPVLTPLAAVGVIVVMVGAARRHVIRGEQDRLPMNAAIALVALVVAVGRFGDL